ncbi:bifunctional (p)ppGpp synthetase/guanosine-3',5'-bis(diphosphate) 3'-pyrophosphohydrolase [soil metagenome]
MKTGIFDRDSNAAPIVQLTGVDGDMPPDARDLAAELAQMQRARAFAEPLLHGQKLRTGEDVLAHADGMAAILQGMGAAPSMCAAGYLVHAGDYLNKPDEVVTNAFGPSYASLVSATRKLMRIQLAVRDAKVHADQRAEQTERVRKMLLAFSQDLRVVLLRLASRLQTLRWFAQSKQPCPSDLALETLQVFAPLANRLGIWQIKWELEDLAFRFTQPEAYKAVARMLDEKRLEREQRVEAARLRLEVDLQSRGIKAEVQGRPKHIYSIWKKMQGKSLDFERVFDVRALRVIVEDVPSCYVALGRVHELFHAVTGEFDDYIARPKSNGYQSLHTVVEDDDGRAVEVQIRTRAMHDHAEHGVAAHWAYKEAGARGYAGVAADGDFEARVAEARKSVLRQLLAWEHDFSAGAGAAGVGVTSGSHAAGGSLPDAAGSSGTAFDDRIYVFTPQAAVVELVGGATPIDFAYSVHTNLGHRCRGAKVDGQLVPLNTRLQSGQTIEVISIKEGGPSLDWLNADLGYLQSPRSRSKVRAWFNALAQQQTIAKGRELVEKLLQREGRTAFKLDDLAAQLGFRSSDALFEVVGKDEYSLRNIESLLRPPTPAADPDDIVLRRSSNQTGQGGVLVVGVDSLLTSLARCCRPAPPDPIGGYVTRGKGVAVHRADCSNFLDMSQRAPERVLPVAWGTPRVDRPNIYLVDVVVEANDRQGLLRDISEVFAKEKMNVTGVHTQSVRDARGGTAWMTFTIEVHDAARLRHVLALVAGIDGVRGARRK